MHLLTAGDSWTFGSEIKDPNLPDTVSDWDSENNAYRIPKIWPTKLAKVLQADDLSNISYPANPLFFGHLHLLQLLVLPTSYHHVPHPILFFLLFLFHDRCYEDSFDLQ